jgi:biotin synthase
MAKWIYSFNFNKRLDRLFNQPNKEDLLYFLKTQRHGAVEALYHYADRVRKQFVGDAIYLRAIIEFSNYCRQGCRYCGINKYNRTLTRYRMTPKEIVNTAWEAFRQGYKTVVLQSGEDLYYSPADYFYIIQEIKKVGEIAVTLAVGEKSIKDYRAYHEAGADRFLLKLETSDPGLYDELKPGAHLKDRVACLKALKVIGFQTGSGIMIGLPGQTLESIADDILLFKELKLDMIGCGPYIPHPDTPLHQAETGSEDLTYRVLALNRVVTRDTNLPATTALSTVNETEGRRLALQRGANVVMPNFTPEQYRRYYEIYPNKKRIEVGSVDFKRELEELAVSLGRFIAETP